jgi:hypothetical protein
MSWLTEQEHNQEIVKYFFEQARNLVVAAVFFGAALWMWRAEATGFSRWYNIFTAVVLSITATVMLYLVQNTVFWKIKRSKFPRYAQVLLALSLTLIITGVVTAITKATPPSALHL